MSKVLFLASGGGGNFKFLHHAQSKEIFSGITFYVVANRVCGATKYACHHDIPCQVIDYSLDNSYDLRKALNSISPDIIISTWNKIIDKETVDDFRGKIVNLHYSLLPAFGGCIGVQPVKMAKVQGCKYVGVTSHFVDEEVDAGKIICQAILKVEGEYNMPQIMNSLFRKGCLILLNTLFLTGILHLDKKTTDSDYSFSPSLQYNQKIFSEGFWEEVRCL